MKFIPELSGESADQRHVNNRSRLVLAPGANYYNGRQTSHVWQQSMSRSGKKENLTETGNRARKVSGTQGSPGNNRQI